MSDLQVQTQEHDVQIAQAHAEAYAAFERVFNAIVQERPDMADLIVAGWEAIQRADQNYQGKVTAVMQMLNEVTADRDAINEAKEQLERALDDPHGSDHPAMMRLLESLRDDIEEHYENHVLPEWKERYMDELVNDAMEEASNEVFGELAERIAEQLDVDEFNAHTLLELLTGESSYQINDDHARALLALQEEIEKWNATQRRMRRAAILDFLNENELAQSS